MVNIARLCVVFLFLCSSYNVRGLSIAERSSRNENAIEYLKRFVKKYIFCDICKAAAGLITRAIESNKTFDDIRPDAIKVCDIALDIKKYRGSAVCPGLIDEYGPPTIFIISQREFDPDEVCQHLNFCPPSTSFADRKPSFTFTPRQEMSLELAQKEASGAEPLRVLHLTDIHMDHLYAEGHAGRYGDYRCDLPLITLNVLISAIKDLKPAPDFILYTGDTPPHDVWQESWNTQMTADFNMIKHLAAEFKGIPIYPAFGNHETYPESLYYQPGEDYKNLTIKTAEWWKMWFNLAPDETASVEYAAYYTHLIKPGLRVLSINTDFGYTMNFYVLLNEQIKAYKDQLAFMESTLQSSRNKSEKVIILGHVPPGDEESVTMEYGDLYIELVSRYSDVIVMQAFGHTHHDQFEVVNDPQKNVSAGVIFIAPSATTYTNVNPSFREYLVDPTTFGLLDYNQYFLNLTEANESGKPTVRLSYSLIKEYGLTDPSPISMEKLTDRFIADPALFQKYNDNFYARSGFDRNCDADCQKRHYCGCRSASLRTLLKCLKE